MFEEAQLYSPVTKGDDGSVTVHLGDDHPGVNDPDYRERRNAIAAAALEWKPGEPIPQIDYTDAEHEVWRTVCRELAPKHERLRVPRVPRRGRRARPADRPDPAARRGDRRPAAADRVRVRAGGRASSRSTSSTARWPTGSFHSTQYVRHHDAPLYTPEPDLIHEVIGHGHLLADPQVAEVNRLAGEAARRCETQEGLQVVADVFWFTIEFGVLREDGELRAYGAGILSSYGEIEEFRGMEIRPLDFAADGDDRVRHHALPADPVRRRVDDAHGRRRRLVLRGLRRRDAGAARSQARRSQLVARSLRRGPGPARARRPRARRAACSGSAGRRRPSCRPAPR